MTTLSEVNVESFLQGALNASINYELLVTLVLALVLSSFFITACWFVFNTVVNAINFTFAFLGKKIGRYSDDKLLSARSK